MRKNTKKITTTKKTGKTITLQDIADRLGCSKNTVSLAMRNSDRISEETRKRIHKSAQKLGYFPNQAARNLATNRSGMIGIYTKALKDAVRTELVNSLIANLHSAQYSPILGLGQDHPGSWHTSPWMTTFRTLAVEAIVVVGEMEEHFSYHHNIPTILVGCHPNKKLPCDYIALDRKEAAVMGIEHLISQGYKNILIACDEKSPYGRWSANTLKAANLKPHHIPADYPLNDPQKDTYIHALIDYIKKTKTKTPDAVIFFDSPLAVEFMHTAQNKGLKIPRDLAVIGYDYFPWADMLKVPLTTIEQPIDELAQKAVALVKTRLSQPETKKTQTTLPHKLVIRKST